MDEISDEIRLKFGDEIDEAESSEGTRLETRSDQWKE